MYLKEENLKATTNRQVVKIGDTVRRKVKGGPILHLYLQYLEKAGMDGVPRFFGLDEKGREILSYLPGKTVGPDYSFNHPCVHSDRAICDMARFMRKLHDVSAGFLLTAIENSWENPYFSDGDHETICHGDATIWNFVLVDDRIAGIFDFDQAYPGTRVWDLTTILFSAVLPSCYDYEPAKHAADTRRRIKLFFNAYGMDCPADIIALTADRIQRHFIDDTLQRAEAGDGAYIRAVEGGSINHYQNVVAYLKAHIYDWL